MLLKSPALDKLLAEFGSADKISKFEQDVRAVLIESGAPIGYLLWISQCDELNLTFDGIKFSKFIHEQTLQINELELIQEVRNKSQAFELDIKDLHQRLASQKSNSHDPWQVCCGHHLIEILSLGLRKAIGSAKKAQDVEPTCLERSLRLAYETVHFQDTQLYADIRIWESQNVPFKVLRNRN
jgi:hypothetical protein